MALPFPELPEGIKRRQRVSMGASTLRHEMPHGGSVTIHLPNFLLEITETKDGYKFGKITFVADPARGYHITVNYKRDFDPV